VIDNIIICKKLEVFLDYYKEFNFNSFIDLAENNVLDMEFALKIAPSTGSRNILVHEYQKIDDEIVFKSIDNIFRYYLVYIGIISSYLRCI
jgi:uncharacterized protein YutE (UPF0331/DUF86 family)